MPKKKISRPRRKLNVPKKCAFCEEKKTPSYLEVEMLRRFISDRGKIAGRARSGLCARHQNDLTTAIKHARYLALLSYIPS